MSSRKYGQMATFPVSPQHRPQGPQNGLTGHLNASNQPWDARCGEGLILSGIFAPLLRLHRRQASTKLSLEAVPPCSSGVK